MVAWFCGSSPFFQPVNENGRFIVDTLFVHLYHQLDLISVEICMSLFVHRYITAVKNSLAGKINEGFWIVDLETTSGLSLCVPRRQIYSGRYWQMEYAIETLDLCQRGRSKIHQGWDRESVMVAADINASWHIRREGFRSCLREAIDEDQSTNILVKPSTVRGWI